MKSLSVPDVRSSTGTGIDREKPLRSYSGVIIPTKKEEKDWEKEKG